MTMPAERTRAFSWAGQLLIELLDPDLNPDIPEKVREQARRVLRHYPAPLEIVSLAQRDERNPIGRPMLDSAEARNALNQA